jgi:hypothetical protein
MARPIIWTCLRHAKCNRDFRRQPNLGWELTDAGKRQAETAGRWLRRHLPPVHRFSCSTALRAMQTGNRLRFNGALWEIDALLDPRDYGVWRTIARDERDPLLIREKERRPFSFAPQDGESFADCCVRVVRFLHSPRFGKCEISIAHRQILLAARFVLEGLGLDEIGRILDRTDPRGCIDHCHVLQYSRLCDPSDPFDARQYTPRYGWVRSIDPLNPDPRMYEWQRITRPPHTAATIKHLLFTERGSSVVKCGRRRSGTRLAAAG